MVPYIFTRLSGSRNSSETSDSATTPRYRAISALPVTIYSTCPCSDCHCIEAIRTPVFTVSSCSSSLIPAMLEHRFKGCQSTKSSSRT
ncbi:uncharacterized protein LOC106869724 isoform X2 [Octopus bimaculoides]|uniref:uncharacterized protein LOC106869724 isoform X2 n=1 Tax=Octopus bimaculoides TaxID=37653 RepID=UPI0022DF79D1|nr:uncharacterized protein LOC106869724 isoform X2 [Octopus bimaculoides]